MCNSLMIILGSSWELRSLLVASEALMGCSVCRQATTLELPKNAERVMWRIQTHGPGYPSRLFSGRGKP